MGLIYVNPEGPNGTPDPLAAARDIRETFGRMAMNDEETVALIAGGHTFGKAHGAADGAVYNGPEPEGATFAEQGLGWKNSYGVGNAGDSISSGLEGAWTPSPIKWDNSYFDTLFGHEWVQSQSPAGATQWVPKDGGGANTVPDAHDPVKLHAPIMFTTDLALRLDPEYGAISKRFHENPDQFELAFAKAWYKLTHRDMGPHVRSLGPWVPEPQLWQDPVPEATHQPINAAQVKELKELILGSGLTVSQLVATSWASAASFRGTDKRGGANGARLRLEPQKDWEVNDSAEVTMVLRTLENIQSEFNAAHADTPVSLADLIVLGGCGAVEKAAKAAGHDVAVPFSPGRTDASQEDTDVESFAVLEPTFDGFRNYLREGHSRTAEELLIERAQRLTLCAPEMTVLVGGMRVLNANFRGSDFGVFTNRPEVLTTDFFVNLLDMSTKWEATSSAEATFEGRDRRTNELKWTGTRVDVVFGSNSQLRAIAEVYASDDAQEKFVLDFVAAWDKVMNLDRFDLK
jgi:catalase-peroxidase